MLDLPPEFINNPENDPVYLNNQKPQSGYVCFANNVESTPSIESASYPSDSYLLNKAHEIVELYQDGFQWSDLSNMIQYCLNFMETYKNLGQDDKKQCVVQILFHVIDLTNTPLLPDSFTDPLFKMMVPPIVDLMFSAGEGFFSFIPNMDKPSPVTFKEYAITLKSSFVDGFQWSDLAIVIKSSIEFIGGFQSLTFDQKKQAAIDMIHTVIDLTDTPFLPDFFIDPVFKALITPLVDTLSTIVFGKQS